MGLPGGGCMGFQFQKQKNSKVSKAAVKRGFK